MENIAAELPQDIVMFDDVRVKVEIMRK